MYRIDNLILPNSYPRNLQGLYIRARSGVAKNSRRHSGRKSRLSEKFKSAVYSEWAKQHHVRCIPPFLLVRKACVHSGWAVWPIPCTLGRIHAGFIFNRPMYSESRIREYKRSRIRVLVYSVSDRMATPYP